MGLTGGPACIKYLLFIFNLIFVVSGIVVVGVGAGVQAAWRRYEPFLDERFFAAPALLVATGAIVLFVAFFGCCGAVRESHCMTITFSVLLVCIFVLELAAGIAGYVLRGRVQEVLLQQLNDTMVDYTRNRDYSALWDSMQRELRCCGVSNLTSWAEVFPNGSLPLSCCPPPPGRAGAFNCSALEPQGAFQEGCLEVVRAFVVENAVALGGVGVGIALVQSAGIALACCLARAIRGRYEGV